MSLPIPDEPIPLTDANFDEVVQRYPFIIVDFWASWCTPCRIIAPVIEALAKAYAGRVVFGKLNVDENPRTAQRFGVMGIPTLLFVKNRAVVHRIIGAAARQNIEVQIQGFI